MLFSANKGMDAVPIEKAASGGELSRVMLALQKMISEKRQLPSVLFDEIDTGVSGDVAEKIGVLLKEMFTESEVHCITIMHNPRGVQGTNFSYTHEYAFFVIPIFFLIPMQILVGLVS